MTQPQPQPGILDIQLYVGGKSSVQGVPDILKLSSNENPNGPPASAQQALAEVASMLHRYPSSDHSGLRAALAELHGLDAQRIICGCGSDELISFLCQAYSGPEVEVIHTEHGFLDVPPLCHGCGGAPCLVCQRQSDMWTCKRFWPPSPRAQG